MKESLLFHNFLAKTFLLLSTLPDHEARKRDYHIGRASNFLQEPATYVTVRYMHKEFKEYDLFFSLLLWALSANFYTKVASVSNKNGF